MFLHCLTTFELAARLLHSMADLLVHFLPLSIMLSWSALYLPFTTSVCIQIFPISNHALWTILFHIHWMMTMFWLCIPLQNDDWSSTVCHFYCILLDIWTLGIFYNGLNACINSVREIVDTSKSISQVNWMSVYKTYLDSSVLLYFLCPMHHSY